jgi:hypothetical protein
MFNLETIGQYRELAPLTAQWVVITSIVILTAILIRDDRRIRRAF